MKKTNNRADLAHLCPLPKKYLLIQQHLLEEIALFNKEKLIKMMVKPSIKIKNLDNFTSKNLYYDLIKL